MNTACKYIDPILQLLSKTWMEEAWEAKRRSRLRGWYATEGRRILDLIDDLMKLYEERCRGQS